MRERAGECEGTKRRDIKRLQVQPASEWTDVYRRTKVGLSYDSGCSRGPALSLAKRIFFLFFISSLFGLGRWDVGHASPSAQFGRPLRHRSTTTTINAIAIIDIARFDDPTSTLDRRFHPPTRYICQLRFNI